ncbi:hypothetical protein Tco_0170852, partial [Tanacetum coccineum]
LTDKEFFLKITIQKSSFDIHLVDDHILDCSIGNEYSDGLYPCNWSKRFFKIKTFIPQLTRLQENLVPLDNIIGNPSLPVSTRKQLASDALWCCFHTELSKVEPKNFKMAVIEDCWFQAMQDDRLEVWEYVRIT